jgi:hypothetical protein
MNGARIVLVDPHAGDGQSLVTRAANVLGPALLCAPATTTAEIRAALALVSDEAQRRIDGAPQRWPLILAIDEGLRLVRGELGALLVPLLNDLTTEARKYEVHALFLSQRWGKEDTGPFRNTLTAFYMHRMRNDEARKLTGLTARSLPDLGLLQPGEVVLYDALGNLQRLTIPYADSDALGRAGALIAAQHQDNPARLDQARAVGQVLELRPAAPAPAEPVVLELRPPRSQAHQVERRPAEPVVLELYPTDRQTQTPSVIELAHQGERPAPAVEVPAEATSPDTSPTSPPEVPTKCAGSDPEVTALVTSTASQSLAAPSAEDARVLALFRAGKSIPEIVAEVWEVKAGKGGQQYQRLNAQVQDIIRAALAAK